MLGKPSKTYKYTVVNEIFGIENNDEHTIQGIFNLNGQRLNAPQKGINIINGKKVVMK